MSRDIRSFFTTLPKKDPPNKQTENVSKKRAVVLSDSEDDNDDLTNKQKQKVDKIGKKRKINRAFSDSDDDSKQKSLKTNENLYLKPVNIADVFGESPVKQTTITPKKQENEATKKDHKKTPKKGPMNKKPTNNKTEIEIHDDDDFEKTLLELDISQNAKKSKLSKQLNESGIDPDQERFEKHRHSAASYQKYLNRGKPVHLGQKEYPKGKPNCLENLCFLRTGVLDSLEGDDFNNLVKEHGGRVVHAVSRKVNFVVVGEEPGPAKLEKASNYGIKTITEDEFLDMILIKSNMEPKYVKNNRKSEEKQNKNTEANSTPKKHESSKKTTIKKIPKIQNSNDTCVTIINENNPRKLTNSQDLEAIVRAEPKIDTKNSPWTEKYKPKNIKEIIGQQGNESSMRKLLRWLENWETTYVKKATGIPKSYNPNEYKCALLSGPPGVGKTTTATLVAQEVGYDVVEFNASDTRSKKLLIQEVSQILDTKSLAGFVKNGVAPTKKRVLLMDEVDGMSGNEDRGGVQELIMLIKKSNIPIICMCNDRYHPKIASLLNYCLDLKFTKPKLEQIRGFMMSVCFKENLKLSPNAVSEIIQGTENDVRQTLTHLSFFTRTDNCLSVENAKTEADKSHKDVNLGVWEVCRKVFSINDNRTMSLAEKCKLFFYDYSIGPLFVHENYRNVNPNSSEKWKKFALAAHSISKGDAIDRQIRSSNNWSLLELQAIHSSVIPGFHMQGDLKSVTFPKWLGSNSKRNKFKRLIGDVHLRMSTSTHADLNAVNLDYIPALRSKLVNCLVEKGQDGIKEAVEIFNFYSLIREDLDTVAELTKYEKKIGEKEIGKTEIDKIEIGFPVIDVKVKTAFTRALNKTISKLPYSGKGNKKTKNFTENDNADEEDVSTESEDDDIAKDQLIMAKNTAKKRAASKKETTKKPPSKTKKTK